MLDKLILHYLCTNFNSVRKLSYVDMTLLTIRVIFSRIDTQHLIFEKVRRHIHASPDEDNPYGPLQCSHSASEKKSTGLVVALI
jgi:hypothetical protein